MVYKCAAMADTKIFTVLIIVFFIYIFNNSESLQTGSQISVNKSKFVAEKLIPSLKKALDFLNKYFYEINLDGALGIILTEAQLRQALKNTINEEIKPLLLTLIEKCQISKKIIQLLPKTSKNILFTQFLLNPRVWENDVNFEDGHLQDLGIYESWTIQDIMKNRSAHYEGVSSDTCLTEILAKTPNDLHVHYCSVSSKCANFMFGRRIDTGYILTHRLLYLHIVKMVQCAVNRELFARTITNYCSLILKEAKTNAYLQFPQHDIFLEQVVLCGMEGFTEFLTEEWTSIIMNWQTLEGCYKENGTQVQYNDHNIITSRSANVIAFGCTDHATGLGAAALALNLRHILQSFEM